MTHFRFNSEYESDDNYMTSVSFDAENLFDVIENFKLFLRGVGYSFHDIEVHMDDPAVINEYNEHQAKKFLEPEDEAFEQILKR